MKSKKVFFRILAYGFCMLSFHFTQAQNQWRYRTSPTRAYYTPNVGIGATWSSQSKLLVVGPDNDGSKAGIKIQAGNQVMLLDGNEIDGLHGLYLNHNTKTNIFLAQGGGYVGIGTTSPTSRLSIIGDIAVADNRHRRGKFRFWQEANVSDAYVSHALGTEPFHNTYGPGSRYNHSIGHRFYTYRGGLIAQIGYGGSGARSNRYDSEFRGVIRASRFLYRSDKRFKKEINPLNRGIEKVQSLKAQSFFLDKKRFENKNFDERKHFGFVAQDVQKVFPELVFEDEDGYLSVDYISLIPVLWNAFDELASNTVDPNQQNQLSGLQEQNKKLADQLEFLKEQIESIQTQLGQETLRKESIPEFSNQSAALYTNIPNPFIGSTEIGYFIPKNTKVSQIQITSLNGKLIHKFDIRESGNGRIKLDATNLSSGIYNYSLIVDGQLIDSKKMVVK